MLNEMHSESRQQTPPKSRWNTFKSVFNTNTLKKVGGNILELSATGLQIASEITTFVAGMGFFISPPLKKVYTRLWGKNMHYTVNGDGYGCVETVSTPNIPASLASVVFNTSFFNSTEFFNALQDDKTVCTTFDNEPLLSSDVLFSLSYPERLFASSALLFGLGCSGFVIALALKKYGSSLHTPQVTMPPTEVLVVRAKKMHKPALVTSSILLLGSRAAAIYATTTISLTMTLKNITGILQNFSISSAKNISYNSDETTLTNSSQNNVEFVKSFTLIMDFVTQIDFSELREAARSGSKSLEEYDYYIGIAAAASALLLGYFALKTNQKANYYSDILLRHKYYRELLRGDSFNASLPVSCAEHNISPNSETSLNPHRLFFHAPTPIDSSTQDLNVPINRAT